MNALTWGFSDFAAIATSALLELAAIRLGHRNRIKMFVEQELMTLFSSFPSVRSLLPGTGRPKTGTPTG